MPGSDDPDYAWNLQKDGAFITGRTAHRVRDADGLFITAECGTEFRTEYRNRWDDDEDDPLLRDRHKCQRCPWD